MRKLIDSVRSFLSLRVAVKLLGEENVLAARNASEVLGFKDAPVLGVEYSRDTFEWCVAQNKKGEQWKLVSKFGLSMAKLRELKPREFCNSSIWQTLPLWMTKPSSAGYRLINFKPVCVSSPQPLVISKKIRLSPARVQTVAEALIGCKAVHGSDSVRMFSRFCHCGLDYEGDTPLVGNYGDDGMLVYTVPSIVVPGLLKCKEIGTLMCVVPEQKTPR